MTPATKQTPLLTYDEAAELLGIQKNSVKQLVTRGHFHSVPASHDRRCRMLLRSEVMTYARMHAGKWMYAEHALPPDDLWAPVPVPLPQFPEFALVGATSVAALLALIAAFRNAPDSAIRAAIIGAVIALAFVLLLEWARQGKINPGRQRLLEKLAKQADVKPEPFLEELENLLPA